MEYEIIRLDLNGVNSYVAKSKEGFLLFDTGGHLIMDKEYTDRKELLIDLLHQHGCKPGNLKAIILTHGDSDHAFNAAWLRNHYKTVIAMHKEDCDLVENLTIDKMMRNFRFQSIAYTLVSALIGGLIKKVNNKVLKDFEGFTPDVLLNEEDDLSGYGFPAKIIHIPGHTAGSIGVLFERGELICGDIFANVKKPSLAPNALNFNQLKDSASKLYRYNITTVYPGHGDPFEMKLLNKAVR